MDWNVVLQYLPDGLCFVACLVGCLCSWFRTGSLKKSLESFCPSSEPLAALEERVKVLEECVSELSDYVHTLEARLTTLGHTVQDLSSVGFVQSRNLEVF